MFHRCYNEFIPKEFRLSCWYHPFDKAYVVLMSHFGHCALMAHWRRNYIGRGGRGSPVNHYPEVQKRNTALSWWSFLSQILFLNSFVISPIQTYCFINPCNSYGDKSPKSIVARFFSIIWIMLGFIAMAIFTASVTSALTAASLEMKPSSLEGYKVF